MTCLFLDILLKINHLSTSDRFCTVIENFPIYKIDANFTNEKRWGGFEKGLQYHYPKDTLKWSSCNSKMA